MTNETNTTAERDYPPLPSPTLLRRVMPDGFWYGDVHGYTAKQMRAYVDADRASRAQAAQALHTGPCGQCGTYEQPCACKINAILAERGSVAVNKENYLKLVQKAQAAQEAPVDSTVKESLTTQMPILAADHKGWKVDYSGLLSQASKALKHGSKETGLAELLRQLQGHLEELGKGWYEGDAAVVDEFLQVYCVADDVREVVVKSRGES